jgi:hypothetical protein
MAAGGLFQHPARSLSDIAVRGEAKEVRPDARPQARKNRRCIRWNTIEDFFDPRTTQMVADRSPQ